MLGAVVVRPPGHRGADLVLDDDDGDGDGGCSDVAQPRPLTVLALCLKSSHEV